MDVGTVISSCHLCRGSVAEEVEEEGEWPVAKTKSWGPPFEKRQWVPLTKAKVGLVSGAEPGGGETE